jgi:hypothetical protein
MKRETLAISDIYVPVKRRVTLDRKRVDEIAASMLDKGQQTPILVRSEALVALAVKAPEPTSRSPIKEKQMVLPSARKRGPITALVAPRQAPYGCAANIGDANGYRYREVVQSD